MYLYRILHKIRKGNSTLEYKLQLKGSCKTPLLPLIFPIFCSKQEGYIFTTNSNRVLAYSQSHSKLSHIVNLASLAKAAIPSFCPLAFRKALFLDYLKRRVISVSICYDTVNDLELRTSHVINTFLRSGS